MSCSGNCSSCGSDCQKQPLRHPNITGAILGQFMMEMAMRSQKNAAGEITEDVMDDMDRKTMNWQLSAEKMPNLKLIRSGIRWVWPAI